MIDPNKGNMPEIRIDRDGRWYFRNMEMTRTDIIHFFYGHLYRDQHGDYHIKTETEQCLIRVEDVPFVIEALDVSTKGEEEVSSMMIRLSDGTCEELQPDTLWIGKNHIIYCRIKNNGHTARFSRKAYYQLTKYIEGDENLNCYSITIGNISYPIHEIQTN
jgi:hypothetical protein